MQTNVKVYPNSLTSRTQPPPNSHATPTHLSLFLFREKFVTLPTLKWAIFAHSYTFLIYCFTNISIIMAKQTSLFGKISGKIGSVVFSTSGGETISREYNPHVANPNTQAQVDQRARMKLMSQLSASLAQSLAYTKTGLVSVRNKFVKRNFGSSYALDGIAQVSYENLQLTEGNLGLPGLAIVGVVQEGSRNVGAALSTEPSANIKRVVYSFFSKSEENKLSFIKSVISTTRLIEGESAYFQVRVDNVPEGDIVVFAYGMIDTSESATAHYGGLNVVSGSDLAKLVATRAISFTDYQFTQTRGATLGADNQQVAPTEPNKVRIFATALGQGGSVTGGGTYDIGAEVTLRATVNAGYIFNGWLKNGTAQVLSSANPWTFTAESQLDVVASFRVDGSGGL